MLLSVFVVPLDLRPFPFCSLNRPGAVDANVERPCDPTPSQRPIIVQGRSRVGCSCGAVHTCTWGSKHVILRIYLQERHGTSSAAPIDPARDPQRVTTNHHVHACGASEKKKKRYCATVQKHREAQENLKPRVLRSFLAAWMSCAEQESEKEREDEMKSCPTDIGVCESERAEAHHLTGGVHTAVVFPPMKGQRRQQRPFTPPPLFLPGTQAAQSYVCPCHTRSPVCYLRARRPTV